MTKIQMMLCALAASTLMVACSDDGGPNGGDAVVSGDASIDGDASPREGGTIDDAGVPPMDTSGFPTQPCGFDVGDTLQGTVGDNKDFVIGGQTRTFIVQLVNVPSGYGKKLPIVFGFHGTGSYYNIPTKYFKPVSENRPFIYVAPKGSGSFTYPWSFDPPAQNSDLKLFDDMIGCLAAQFDVDLNHIHAFGFSWGGHWINYLVAHRGDVLGSATQISAGAIEPTGATFEGLIGQHESKPAQLVVWGGPTDTYNGYSFEGTSQATVASFLKEGYSVLQCVHDDGHDITPPESFNKFIFEFCQDHPRGLSPDPYSTSWPPTTPFTLGTYLNWPSWCSPAQ